MTFCRICAEDIAEAAVSIFEGAEQLAAMINEICGLQISENDGLPDVACCTCVAELQAAIKLKHKCLESDAALRILLDSNKTKNSINTTNGIVGTAEISYHIVYEEIVEPFKQRVDISKGIAETGCKIDLKELNDAPSDCVSRKHDCNSTKKVISTSNDADVIVNSDSKYVCCGCDIAFENRELLLEHSKLTHENQKSLNEERPFECAICYKRYTSERGLKLHRRSALAFKHHQCAICGKRFGNRVILANHELTHTKEKPFACHVCPKSFGSQSNLLSHVKLHSSIPEHTKHVCHICKKGFSRKSYLKHHNALLHSENKPFACTLCPSKFKAKSNLRLHLRTHTQERPYSCELCNKSFMYPTDKKRHMIQHTGQKPFKCTDCDKEFTRKGVLLKHRACHENEQMEVTGIS
ncbi:zinc finger protein OZF-like [Toxorhynchites rutilus septentrionalis]|uniref:zinc finger protein OZF-like n=1 Tax=Toxorhynchites rutilus septentrionalis TaxID=329112 RepID=UPI0024790F56|nr:zinc finger protein OZF-like [Toxorhynchites rutilus septentrionalis]